MVHYNFVSLKIVERRKRVSVTTRRLVIEPLDSQRLFCFLKGGKMELTKELFTLVIAIYVGMGIVGHHLLKKLQEISNKLGVIDDLIRNGINKLDEIELKL